MTEEYEARETPLDIVMASYRDMFGKTERGTELHKAACTEVYDMATKIDEQAVDIALLNKQLEISQDAFRIAKDRADRLEERVKTLTCPECDSRIMDNGNCMMDHWCGKPLK